MSDTKNYPVKPINHGVVAEKHTPLYNMHRYFAKRAHNLFFELVKYYSSEGGMILDPFCGGGVTVVEALRAKRKVIGIDLSPLATFITRMEVIDADPWKIMEYFDFIEQIARPMIEKLFNSICPQCGKKNIVDWYGWDVVLHCEKCGKDYPVRDMKKILNKKGRGSGKFQCATPRCRNILSARIDKSDEKLTVLSFKCSCGYAGGKTPDRYDHQLVSSAEKEFKILKKRGYWYPKVFVPKGDKFNEVLGKGIRTFDGLFTHRNLVALTILQRRINEITDIKYRNLMMLAFSQTLAGATKMCNDPISGWEGHMYWIPNQMFEYNPWNYYKRNVKAVVEGKQDSQKTIGHYYKEAKNFSDLLSDKTSWIISKSSTDLSEIPENSIDTIITDPPYGGNVNYTELSDFWAVWLWKEFGLKEGQLIDYEEEAIENRTQRKDLGKYQDILFHVFRECHRVLKKDRWLVMTFHNKKFAVWKALHRAAYDAGFILPEKNGIIYQSPIGAYTYTIHQRESGAMLGDFIVSYKRTEHFPRRDVGGLQLSSDEREKLMAEIKRVIEFHGGANENMIFTQIMPFLMNTGLLHKIRDESLDTLLDKKRFVKVDGKWHLAENVDEKGKLKPIQLIPAETRIEQLIRSFFASQDNASIDDILRVIFTNLINGDTPTTEEIQHVMDRICEKIIEGKGGKREVFSLKKKKMGLFGQSIPIIKKKQQKEKPKLVKIKTLTGETIIMGEDSEPKHTRIIQSLYELGKQKGYEVHIGQTEQNKNSSLKGISYPMGSNIQYGLSPEVFQIIREIDVLWITSANTITHGFEVEASTNIVTGISRFRELFSSAPNTTIEMYIVVPDLRQSLALSKINSPANRKSGLNSKIKCITFSDIENDNMKA